jgi:hypothetical protein
MGKTSPSGRDLDQPSSLLHLIFFEHAGIVIFWFIDPFGDSSYGHFFGSERSQDFFRGLSCKPLLVGFRRQNDRHPVVYLGDQLVWFAGVRNHSLVSGVCQPSQMPAKTKGEPSFISIE